MSTTPSSQPSPWRYRAAVAFWTIASTLLAVILAIYTWHVILTAQASSGIDPSAFATRPPTSWVPAAFLGAATGWLLSLRQLLPGTRSAQASHSL